MPVDMLDGDVDYTLNISPLAPNSTYNIALVMDTSFSMNGEPLQQAKDAYVSPIDYFVNNDIADSTRFSVISFNTDATLFRNLSPEDAKSTIQGFTAQGQTNFDAALEQIFSALIVPPFNQQRIAYFLSDGRDANRVNTDLLRDVRRFVNVQAFGFGDEIDEFQLDLIDSDDAVILADASDLQTEFLKSSITRDDIDYVEIRPEGETTPVQVIQPSELINTPLGLNFSGSVDGLDVSLDAENQITAEVFFTDPNLPSTPVNFTVASGGEPISNAIPSEPQNGTKSVNNVETSSNKNQYNASTPLESEPALFTRILEGTTGNDRIGLGTFDLGANGQAGDDKITGNNYDNLLNGGDGDDTITGGRGNDRITITDNDRNDIDGGDGIDTVIYAGNKLSVNSFINRIGGQAVTVDNADILTYVEFIQFTDARISTQTLQVTPVIQVGEVAVPEGNSGNTRFQLTFDLSTPAPVDVQFNYSTTDFEALAGEDYVATSGQLVIPAGETTAAIDIEVIGDRSFELDEKFAVSLSEASGATFINDSNEYAVPIAIENDDDEESNEELIEYVTLYGDENDNNLVGSTENEILLGY